MKTLAELDYDELHARAAKYLLPPLDDDAIEDDELEPETRSGYGTIAVTSDPWLRERANAVLRGLPDPPHPLDALRGLTDDERELVLLETLYELDLDNRHLRAFDPSKHRRWPRGHPSAGKFRPMLNLLKQAIKEFNPDRDKHPFENFTRPQLLKVARDRRIRLDRGESKDSIADKILKDLGGGSGTPEAKESSPAKQPAKRVPTWEELGSPQGPPPVGQKIGYEGGTYELLPGEPRRYRVINAQGQDISDQVQGGQRIGRTGQPEPANQTADDARAALRVDAFNRQRVADDAGSTWRQTLGQVSGSWSYDTGQIEGFDAATPEQRVQIRDALERWTGDKVGTADATRLAEPRVNAAIRGAVPRTEQVERDIEALDLAMTMSRNRRAITVFRGVSNGAHILPADWQSRDLSGVEWSVPGYTPTTGDVDSAEAYAGMPENRGFAFRLKLPRNSSAIAITDEIGGDDNEGEIVLPRDLTFRVTKDRGVQGENGIRWLDVEIVRRPAARRRPRRVAPASAATPTPAASSSGQDPISPLTGQPVSQSAWNRPAAANAATTAVPGASLRRVPSEFTVAPDAYEVQFDGLGIGIVHGNEADPNFGWVPFAPTGASWNLLDPGNKPTKDEAVKELVDSYNAGRPNAASRPTPTPPTPPTPTPAPRRGRASDELPALDDRDLRDLAIEHGVNPNISRRSMIAAIRRKRRAQQPQTPTSAQGEKAIGSLLPTSYQDSVTRDAEIRQAIESRLNGTYAGLTVKVREVDTTTDEVDVTAEIKDANGVNVGTTERIFRRDRAGGLWVYHAYLSLNRSVQGQGFAEAWNGHLMDWYVESGLDRIEVTANIDVGGYTWARQGFDWKDESAAYGIGTRLRRHLADVSINGPFSGQTFYDAEQIAAAQDILDRFDRIQFGDPGYPTAYEVSQAGRKPGQGKDDSWPGKMAMLGSTWSGVKPVPASGAARVP